MTSDYERGKADGLRMAAEVCQAIYRESKSVHGRMFEQGHEWAAELCEMRILSLIPEGADQREAAARLQAQGTTAKPGLLGNEQVGTHEAVQQSASHQNPGEQVADNDKGAPDVRAPARPGPFVMVPRKTISDWHSELSRGDLSCRWEMLDLLRAERV